MAKITIELESGRTFAGQLRMLLGEIGFVPAPVPVNVVEPRWQTTDASDSAFATGATISVKSGSTAGATASVMTVTPGAVNVHPSAYAPTLTDMDGDRKRGEAGPGHRRRTNAQIKEDEQYQEQKKRAEVALATMENGAKTDKFEGVRKEHDLAKQVETLGADSLLPDWKPSISSGEARVNPEDETQDAADEAAETAARASDKPTLEDLRAAVARYTEKFGSAATVHNIRGIVGCAIVDVPVEEIDNAIAKVELAISGSTVITPNSPKDDTPVKPATATRAEIIKALMAYGKLYDGLDDPNKMVCAKEDLPKVFTQMFGAGVTGLGSLPNDKPETLGTLLAAIKHATETNQFKREVQ